MSHLKTALALVLAGSIAATAATAAEKVRIGFNVPLTGFAAADGTSALTGAKLAVEQANTEGGVNGKQIELVIYDDQASPKESAPIAAKLVGETLGKKKTVVITLKNDFGKSLAAGFKEAAGKFGVDVVNEYEYSIKDRQFGPIVSKVKADNPEAIYASGYFFTAGPLVSQLRAAGITVPIIGQEGYDSEKFIEIAGKSAEGVIITTSLDRDSTVAETKNFIMAYEKLAKAKPDMVAASGHTAVKVAVAAMVFVGALGVGVYRLCYQPILDKPPYVALIASIGLFVAMGEIFRLVFGPYGISYTAPPLLDSVTVGGMNLKQAELGVMAGTVVLIGGLALLAGRTRIGAAWRATVTDPAMAQSFGIDIVKVRYLNFFIGSALAAAAGVMVALLNNLVEPTMGAVASYKGLAIIVLGGLGDVRGTLIAALVLGVIESFGTIYLGAILDRDAIAFAFLIVVLLLRPRGLFGRA